MPPNKSQFGLLGLDPEAVFLTDPDNIWFMKGVSPIPQFIPSRVMNPITLIFTLALFIPITAVVIQLSPQIDSSTWLRLGSIALIVLLVIGFVIIDRVRMPFQLLNGWPRTSLLIGQIVDCTASRSKTSDYPSYILTVRYTYSVPDGRNLTGTEVSIRNDLDGKPLPKPGVSVVIVHFEKPIQIDWFAKRQDFIL